MKHIQVQISNLACRHCKQDIIDVLSTYECIQSLSFLEDVLDIQFKSDMEEQELIETIENCGNFRVIEIKKV